MKAVHIAVLAFGLTLIVWLTLMNVRQELIIHDMKTYINGGCHGRYQGAE